MKTLVYLEDAIEQVEKESQSDGAYGYLDAKSIINLLKSLPSAEPERKTGNWAPVTNGRGGHECDQCHTYAPSWTTGEEHLTNFCPDCGVKMEV